MERSGEGERQCGLSYAGDVLQQYVAAGEDCEQYANENLVLAGDGFAHLFEHFVQRAYLVHASFVLSVSFS